MRDLPSALVRLVRARRLIAPGDRVLVALSGGVDSVVLLHLLRTCAAALRIEVHAAHFDHAMRDGSAADADWVGGLCRACQTPFISERARRPLRNEADARNERYRFLDEVRRRIGAQRIATAHHADDQVETVLFRLLRGTGWRGLAGIPLRRGPVVRPLLRFRKQELIDYAGMYHLEFRPDPTNAELDFARNRIRHQVMPALETVRPDAARAVLALARHAARTERAIQAALARLERELIAGADADVIELARPILLEYHAELRALILRRLLRRFGVNPTSDQTRRLVEFCERADSGAVVRAAAGIQVERAFDRIRIVRNGPHPAESGTLSIASRAGTAELKLGGRSYAVAWQISETPIQGAQQFDPVVLQHGLELRSWRAGDRMRFPYGGKKLKKLFGEMRIPVSERGRLPVLADGRGHVLWIPGLARSSEAPPAERGPILNITVQNAEHS